MLSFRVDVVLAIVYVSKHLFTICSNLIYISFAFFLLPKLELFPITIIIIVVNTSSVMHILIRLRCDLCQQCLYGLCFILCCSLFEHCVLSIIKCTNIMVYNRQIIMEG